MHLKHPGLLAAGLLLTAAALTACSLTETPTAPEPETVTQKLTSSPSTEPQVSTITEIPLDTSTAVPITDSPRDFSTLEEVNARQFWGHEQGSLPGWRFQTPSGNIHCHVAEIPAACNVRDHAPWPEADRLFDGVPEAAPTALGWMGEMDLMGRPMNWLQQGSFPATGVGSVLEYGQKISMQRSIDGESSTLTCASRESGLTCMINGGEHGFTVSRESYDAW